MHGVQLYRESIKLYRAWVANSLRAFQRVTECRLVNPELPPKSSEGRGLVNLECEIWDVGSGYARVFIPERRNVQGEGKRIRLVLRGRLHQQIVNPKCDVKAHFRGQLVLITRLRGCKHTHARTHAHKVKYTQKQYNCADR